MTHAPNRRWFRFSLRTLFVVVTVVAVGAAWTAYHLNWIRQRHAMLSESTVQWTNAGFEVEINTPLSLRLLGESGIEALVVPQSELHRANRLFPEAILNVRQ